MTHRTADRSTKRQRTGAVIAAALARMAGAAAATAALTIAMLPLPDATALQHTLAAAHPSSGVAQA